MEIYLIKRKKVLTFLMFALLFAGYTQNKVDKDSLADNDTLNIRFHYKSLIIPSALIGYGLLATESHTLIDLNGEIKEEVNEHIDEKFTIDDISQYMPAAAVYGLNLGGIKGKHNLRDRTIILGTAYLIMGASVTGLKTITRVERPDGTSRNSFPSGHTATAFMGAEFLYQEYKDVSIWYGIAGYVVAAGTGFFRIYNDRHWMSDVIAGAGIGILSTKIAYWIHPFINKKLFPNSNKEVRIDKAFAPFYNRREMGVGAVIQF